jgi:hypothetical protein
MTRELERTLSQDFSENFIGNRAARRNSQGFVRAKLSRTRQWLARDRGAATAEYAVVSVAAAGLGGILIKLLTSDWFQEILKTILNWIVRIVLNFFGFGG